MEAELRNSFERAPSGGDYNVFDLIHCREGGVKA